VLVCAEAGEKWVDGSASRAAATIARRAEVKCDPARPMRAKPLTFLIVPCNAGLQSRPIRPCIHDDEQGLKKRKRRRLGLQMKSSILASTIVAMLAASMAAGQAKAAELVTNGGFEALDTASAPGSYGSYAYPEGTIAGWTFAGSGLINGTTATPWFGWDAPTGYSGTQYGFVQGTGWLVQSITADATGTLELSWLEGSRPDIFGGGYKGDQNYEVWLGSTLLGSFSTASGQDFVARSLSGASVTAGQSYYLAFHGLSQSDNTAFLDNVSASVTPGVPEPASWALMIAGFGMVGAGMRRRRMPEQTA
jgi:hypothetical protein